MYYSFKIPEPCNEDWNAMSPSAKGRFCSSCEKIVVDFTGMNRFEIGAYLKKHISNGVCGHINKSQLDQVVLKIPAEMLVEQRYSSRFFAVALLIVMGTTLFSCVSDNGTRQKIDAVEVVDTVVQDSILKSNSSNLSQLVNDTLPEDIPIVGGMSAPPPLEPIVALGMVVTVEGEVDYYDDTSPDYNYQNVDVKPKFPGTPIFVEAAEEELYFNKQLSDFIIEHFNDSIITKSSKSDRFKIFVTFSILANGLVDDVEVRSDNNILSQEAKRVISLLPHFIPAKKDEEHVPITYTMPIIF
jgi:hypothetical protein